MKFYLHFMDNFPAEIKHDVMECDVGLPFQARSIIFHPSLNETREINYFYNNP